jgi:F-type H+-transporting ATPase subunit b
MQINWFTVIAQVINFLILVWLLRRFLYKPILDSIDERETKITSQLHEAEAKKAEAKKEQDEFIHKNQQFDQQKQELMDGVLNEAKEVKHKLFEEARNEANALRTKLETTFKEMQERANNEIVQKTQQEVFAIARKTLTDLSSVSLEEQSTIIFISKLKDLKEEERKHFMEAFKTVDTPILVQSAFELPKHNQDTIKSTLSEILGVKTEIQFKTSPKLISGIELTTSGYKLAWSISEYLNALESTI